MKLQIDCRCQSHGTSALPIGRATLLPWLELPHLHQSQEHHAYKAHYYTCTNEHSSACEHQIQPEDEPTANQVCNLLACESMNLVQQNMPVVTCHQIATNHNCCHMSLISCSIHCMQIVPYQYFAQVACELPFNVFLCVC